MNRKSMHSKNSRSSQVISNGIYFGQFQPTLISNTNLTQAIPIKQNVNIRKTAPISNKRLQSPKIISPKQKKIALFKTQGFNASKPLVAIQTLPTNRSSMFRLKSPTKIITNQLISQDMDNKSIEILQDIVNSQLNKNQKKSKRPVTAGGVQVFPSQHFSNRKEQYLLLEQIGHGSYGIVKLGQDLLNGNSVAIKIYERIKIINKREYIKKEIQILSALSHPNIVQLLDVVYTDTQIQLIMEFGGPISLRQFLKQQVNSIIDENEAKSLFFQIVKAVDYCHTKNIIHRDIKLENILIKENQIKLIDFGFSSYLESKSSSQYCGTPSYMAPEIILKIDYGKPSDVWSLGVLLYVMLHGRFPFQGKDQKELFSKIKCGYFIQNGISQQAQRLINNMLRVRSYERWNTKEILKDSWFQQ